MTAWDGELDWDLVDGLRYLAGDLPRACRRPRHEPHALEAHVVEVADLQDVLVGVDGALHGGLLDRLELRRAALIRDLRRLQRLAHARRLRDLREQNGFGGLRRARHRREDARPLVLERDLLELGRQVRRRERPRTGEVRRREPAARDEEVDGAALPHPEDVAVGVADPEELLRAWDSQVVRLAPQQHQLRRLQADEHPRRLAGADLLARQARLHFFPVLVVRQLLEALRQRAGRGPRPFTSVAFIQTLSLRR